MRSLNIVSTVVALVLAAVACTPVSPIVDPNAGAPVTATMVAHFDASAGELPEGFVLTKDSAYVGFAPTSRVVRVDLVAGTATAFGQLPLPVPGKGFMTGLASSPAGDVYAGLASFVPEVQAGIYRIPKEGGAATLFAKDMALPFPNALAFDTDGSLWATDSGARAACFTSTRAGARSAGPRATPSPGKRRLAAAPARASRSAPTASSSSETPSTS
jgi:hypothetical protein